MAEPTPMMKQYLEIKRDNPDSILFFRLGDFYEMFADDAKLAKELDPTLTSRDKGKHAKPEAEQIPMCGIPYHASEAYIARLIAKGYKVAICEQMEDPATAKGLVKRDIIRVVTPGTVTDAACLEEKSSNFICAVYADSRSAGVAFCDITTGRAHLTSFSGKDRLDHVVNWNGAHVHLHLYLGKKIHAVINTSVLVLLPLLNAVAEYIVNRHTVYAYAV